MLFIHKFLLSFGSPLPPCRKHRGAASPAVPSVWSSPLLLGDHPQFSGSNNSRLSGSWFGRLTVWEGLGRWFFRCELGSAWPSGAPSCICADAGAGGLAKPDWALGLGRVRALSTWPYSPAAWPGLVQVVAGI